MITRSVSEDFPRSRFGLLLLCQRLIVCRTLRTGFSSRWSKAKTPLHLCCNFEFRLSCDHASRVCRFDPKAWRKEELKPSMEQQGFFEIDLAQLHLADGEYEYEFVLDGRENHPVADPYAEEITKFGGYRGVFRIADGKRWRLPFSWDDEFPSGVTLPNNHELVIYEMPMRWMESAPEQIRQVGLGTFEKATFMRLDELKELGINAIELLPVQDSPDSLS